MVWNDSDDKSDISLTDSLLNVEISALNVWNDKDDKSEMSLTVSLLSVEISFVNLVSVFAILTDV